VPWTSEYTNWLVDTGGRLNTADGKEVEVWEFRHEKDEHEKDEAVLSAWAKHFWNHHCFDSEIDYWRGGVQVFSLRVSQHQELPGVKRCLDLTGVLAYLGHLRMLWIQQIALAAVFSSTPSLAAMVE